MSLVVPFRRIGVAPLVWSSSEDVSCRVRNGPKHHELQTAEPASRMGTYAAEWAAKELHPPFFAATSTSKHREGDKKTRPSVRKGRRVSRRGVCSEVLPRKFPLFRPPPDAPDLVYFPATSPFRIA
jgi:hypothetical protein